MRDKFRSILQSRPVRPIGEDKKTAAAVLIPLVEKEDGTLELLFQVRSADLAKQPGDICFPGGGAEPGEMPQETAVREACEELLITADTVEVLGASDYLEQGNLRVYPFAGILHGYGNTFSQEEVKEVFTVPLDWFLQAEPEQYTMEWVPAFPEGFPFDKIWGGRDYAWRKRLDRVLFYEYEDRVIWGMTAKILEAFLRVVREADLTLRENALDMLE